MARLYHVPLSPFCRKVRLVLAEKKVDLELVEEKYWEPSSDFLARNPAAKVPVLRIDGLVLAESQAICEYLEATRPEPPLGPKDPVEAYEMRRVCAFFDDTFHRVVTANILYERVNKKITGEGYPDSRNVKAGLKAIRKHLGHVEHLLDTRRWLAGDRITLADFACAGHVSALDYISDVDWNTFPALRDWYARIKSRPAFRSVLAAQVPGFRPSPQYADLDF